MGFNFNKKVRCKCKKYKQAVEVDTLVHLYDSLNGQIESARNEIKAYMQVGTSSDINTEAKTKFEAAYTELEKRLKKLVGMRANIEELLDKILKTGATE